MSYESWRISYQSSEQAARAAYEECEDLRFDAERYLWLIQKLDEDLIFVTFNRIISSDMLDNAIDAEMEKDGANG